MMRRIGTLGIAGLLTVMLVPAVAATAQRRPDAPAAGGGDAVTAGADAWDAGNYARAIAIWRPLAVAGNPYAQYNLGQAYRLGNGVTIDEKIAQDWYYKAAQQGHAQAQANYGLLMFQSGNRKGALPWLQKAADKGDPRAQYVVGTALFNGDLAGKDWVRAYALMTRAAASGLKPAVTSLSEMDKYMSLQQRTQGTAIARDLERSAALSMVDENKGKLVAARPAKAPPAVASAPPPPRPLAMAQAAPVPAPLPAPPKAAAAKAPPPKPIAPAPKAAPKPALAPLAASGDGGWRVQVGAFGDAAGADSVWQGIVRKAPGLGLRSYLVKAGAVTRLQAGPLASRADANRACARIKATGAECFPVAAR